MHESNEVKIITQAFLKRMYALADKDVVDEWMWEPNQRFQGAVPALMLQHNSHRPLFRMLVSLESGVCS